MHVGHLISHVSHGKMNVGNSVRSVSHGKMKVGHLAKLGKFWMTDFDDERSD